MGAASDAYSIVVGSLDMLPGWSQPVVEAAPAPGATVVTHRVPGQYWERVRLLRVSLTTSAVAGNRGLILRITDTAGTVYWEVPAAGVVAPSSTVTANGCDTDVLSVSASGLQVVPIPD